MKLAIRSSGSKCFVAPDAKVLRRDPSFGRHRRRLGEDEARAADRARREMGEMPVVGETVLAGILAHRRNANPVGVGDVAQFEFAEQMRHQRPLQGIGQLIGVEVFCIAREGTAHESSICAPICGFMTQSSNQLRVGVGEIERLELRIEELREAIERSRRLMLAGRVAVVVGPALIVASMLGALGFTPVRMVVAIALAIGGMVLSGSSRSSTEQLEHSLQRAEAARRAALDGAELVEFGEPVLPNWRTDR